MIDQKLLTFLSVAKTLNLTEMQVSRRMKKALKILYTYIADNETELKYFED